jgi:hypothetical protein
VTQGLPAQAVQGDGIEINAQTQAQGRPQALCGRAGLLESGFDLRVSEQGGAQQCAIAYVVKVVSAQLLVIEPHQWRFAQQVGIRITVREGEAQLQRIAVRLTAVQAEFQVGVVCPG